MKLRNLLFSLLAGFGAIRVHIVLMAIKHRAGILPGFEPYEDLQRLLSSMTAQAFEPPLSWLLPYINGALILGIVAWLVMGFGLLPLTGNGIFDSRVL